MLLISSCYCCCCCGGFLAVIVLVVALLVVVCVSVVVFDIVIVVVVGVADLSPCFYFFRFGFVIVFFYVCFLHCSRDDQKQHFLAISEGFSPCLSQNPFLQNPSLPLTSFLPFRFFFFLILLFVSRFLPFCSFILSLSLVHFQSLFKQFLLFLSFSIFLSYFVVCFFVFCFCLLVFCLFLSCQITWSKLPCFRLILLYFIGSCLVIFFCFFY